MHAVSSNSFSKETPSAGQVVTSGNEKETFIASNTRSRATTQGKRDRKLLKDDDEIT
jgi:hypothetical protein